MRFQIKKFMVLYTSSLLLLSGCSGQVEAFVRENKPVKSEPAIEMPPAIINSPMAIKLTPGKVNAVADGLAVQGTFTNTNQTFMLGSDARVSLTISRNRVAPQ